jgi:hypothetical protein
MAYGSGLSAQFGYAEEATYGTRVAPTKFAEFNSESVKLNIQRQESKGLRAGRIVQGSTRWATGPHDAAGAIQLDVVNKGLGLLLKHLFGAVATSQPSAGPDPTVFEHKFTLGDLTGKGLTMQFGRPSIEGTVRPWEYSGGKIVEGSISTAIGEAGVIDLSVIAADESVAQVLATATYPTGLVTLDWAGAAVTIGGTAYDCKSAKVSIKHGFKTDRFKLGTLTRSEPIRNAFTEIGVELTSDYVDNVAYARFTAGTLAAVTFNLVGAVISNTYKFALEVTLPSVRFDGETPNTNGPDVIEQPITGKALDDGSTDSPIKVVYRTTDVTP